MTFANKTAIVTGAGGGMGLNIARDLLAAGAHVTMIDLKPEPPADLPAGRGRYLIGDVTEDTFVFKAVAQAFQETGRLDYLVNAAGVLWFGRDKSLVEIDLDLWDKILTIDLKSMVITARHAVPFMQKTGGGSMVHISSIQCLRGDDKPQDAYQASKAGMLALSKSLAIQFAGDRIRSNCILPGPVESPMQDRWRENPAQKSAVAGAVPLGRVGTTQDMADAALFLLSDRAAYITGIELIVDGGLTARP
ncbi:MAG TPA: SDR family oxidoreductase [Verrucomicrobiae bacterium]|jgi:NAD(P)-dependent dehydrogenase (short-subunit alcohol dehydrogenase family)|nr:SDR family oxidoreductase [Verrucomicrobiae bacterium]